eukprot:7906702-Ditylum_brightwellii.AAC.1
MEGLEFYRSPLALLVMGFLRTELLVQGNLPAWMVLGIIALLAVVPWWLTVLGLCGNGFWWQGPVTYDNLKLWSFCGDIIVGVLRQRCSCWGIWPHHPLHAMSLEVMLIRQGLQEGLHESG